MGGREDVLKPQENNVKQQRRSFLDLLILPVEEVKQ